MQAFCGQSCHVDGDGDGDGLALRSVCKSSQQLTCVRCGRRRWRQASWRSGCKSTLINQGWGEHMLYAWGVDGGQRMGGRGLGVRVLTGQWESSRQGGGLEGPGSDRCLIEVHAMLLCGEGRDCAAGVDQGVSRSKQRRRCNAGSVLTRAAYTALCRLESSSGGWAESGTWRQ